MPSRRTPAKRGPGTPRFWAQLTESQGAAVQIAGTAAGIALIVAAGRVKLFPLSTALMLLGFLGVYLCTHALAHWSVGRLLGLRFAYVGIRGTDHPENYPLGLRELMSILPMFTAVSTKDSRTRAGRWALAAYFAAGETATAVCSLLAALLAVALRVPGSRALLIAVVIFTVVSIVVTAVVPKGDYAKALRALRREAPPARPRG